MGNTIKAVTFLAYPEWCTVEYLEELARIFPVVISPLHDKDVYKSGNKKGETKKAHWHILFQGNPTKTEMNYIKKILHSPTDIYTERVHNGESLYQYLTHSDKNSVKSGKAQYNVEDMIISEKFNEELLESADEESNLKKLTDIVLGEDIQEYWQFAVRLLEQDDEELKMFAFKNDQRMKRLIDSRRWSAQTKVTKRDEYMTEEFKRLDLEEQNADLNERISVLKDELKAKDAHIYDLAKKVYDMEESIKTLTVLLQRNC